jgi:hypothetical protein
MNKKTLNNIATADHGGPHGDEITGCRLDEGFLNIGCIQLGDNPVPVCPGNPFERIPMIIVDEEGFDKDGLIKIPTRVVTAGGSPQTTDCTFKWHIRIDLQVPGINLAEPEDFVPLSGETVLGETVEINIRDNFGGPICVPPPPGGHGDPNYNCPEGGSEYGFFVIEEDSLPEEITYNSLLLGGEKEIFLAVKNIDPYDGPTKDKATFCEQYPDNPQCQPDAGLG